MRRFGRVWVVLAVLFVPIAAEAQQVSLSVGRFLGDDLVDTGSGPGGLLPTSFSDAGLYGIRLGMGFVLVDVEASGLIGRTSLFDDTPFQVEGKFRYLEGSALLRLFPGPVAPFIAAGIGFHRLSLDAPGVPDYDTVGYNLGGGVKVMLGALGVRADIRDHITPLRLEDIDPELREALGLDEGKTLHNFEVSVGVMLSF